MLDQIDAFFSLVERFKRWRGKRGQSESPAGRFLRLFESHGVHRNQIPRFFGQGLTLKDVQDEQALLPCLSLGMMDEACRLFGVRNAWLERGESPAYAVHHFFLDAIGFGHFLDGLQSRRVYGREAEFSNVRLEATIYGVATHRRRVQGVWVISEAVGLLESEPIYRRHLIDPGPLGYWKARVSAASLVAQALKRDIWISGRWCDSDVLHKVLTAKDLPDTDDWATLSASDHFYPDDWLIDPNALLEGVDEELDHFGHKSALELWLSLHEKGLMMYRHAPANVREVFKAALENAV